jgi:hypothetical protein
MTLLSFHLRHIEKILKTFEPITLTILQTTELNQPINSIFLKFGVNNKPDNTNRMIPDNN